MSTSTVFLEQTLATVTVEGDDQVAVVTETVVDVVEVGILGPQGRRGEIGETGPSGGAFRYSTADVLLVWPVAHDLGYRPSLAQCVDDAGTHHEPTVRHIDANNLELEFAAPTAGYADFS